MIPLQRLGRAWRSLQPEQRLAAVAAILLLLSMLLPWYQETGNAIVNGRLASISDNKSAFQVYSFVEAAIFLVALGVLVLMFARGERRAFHLPGGDGLVVMAGGLWVMLLIFYRQLDKPNGRSEGPINTSIGVQWGIFIAFLLGALLAYAGWRIRAAQIGEPPADDVAPPPPPRSSPGERAGARDERGEAGGARRASSRGRGRTDPAGPPPPMEGQLSFDEAPPPRHPAAAPDDDTTGADSTTTVAWEEPPTRRARRRDVFERPADPDGPSEFDPPRRRRR
jgi:hypothetical protein